MSDFTAAAAAHLASAAAEAKAWRRALEANRAYESARRSADNPAAWLYMS